MAEATRTVRNWARVMSFFITRSTPVHSPQNGHNDDAAHDQEGQNHTAQKDLVKLFDITLPRTEAYYVISKDGDVDNITVEYGKTFSFRVVLSPDYDKSDCYCYINTLYVEPDEFGYYDVTGPIVSEGMATAGGVQEDISIAVMGVSANERKEMVNSLVGFIQEIFSVFKEIFSYFSDIFTGLGEGLGLGI